MGKRLQLTSSFISLCLALKVCSTLFFETGYLADLGLTILATLAVQQSPEICLSPPPLPFSLELQAHGAMAAFLLAAGDPDPDSQASTASPLSTEPSPKPR